MFAKPKVPPEKVVSTETDKPEIEAVAPIVMPVPLIVRHRPEIVVDRRAAAIAARLART